MDKMIANITIGITLGDPNGVGAETVIKIFRDSRMFDMATFVLYGSSKSLAYYKSTVEGGEQVGFNVVRSAADAKAGKLNLVECGTAEMKTTAGVASSEGGVVAVESLRRAVADVKAGDVDVIVTAPINKNCVNGEGFEATGHTEFLAKEFEGEALMLMCSDMMKVGLATIHVPVAEVAGLLSKELVVKRIGQLEKSLREDFGVRKPRIAVLALNPHAGDGGLLGTEEQEIIKPAIVEAYEKGTLAFGPFAADGFFATGGYRKYDAVLAMYHDQGLAPFKMLTPYGVNVTTNLSVVRTSPDHGVGYDIAGKGVADESSMRNAIYMAVDIFESRQREAEYAANPLPHHERERGHRGDRGDRNDRNVSDIKELRIEN